MKRAVLHIDRLVLKGFEPSDQQGIAEGLRQELARQVGAPGALDDLVAHAIPLSVNVGQVSLGHALTPMATGAALAQGIRKGLKP